MLARRDVLKGSVATLLLAPLAACGERTGPEDISWGRDACEHCRMIISERPFATELRGGPRKRIYKFDDVGCAIHWARHEKLDLGEMPEFWVMSHADGKAWLDARQAFYRIDVRSPMNYNFGAVPAVADAAVPYAEMVRRIAAGTSHSDCPPPTTSVASADSRSG